jgi:hypothetical protein
MKHFVVILVVLLSLFIMSCPHLNDAENPNNSGNSNNPGKTSTKYTKEYWGEWLRMDANETWYISSRDIKINNYLSQKTISLIKQSDRVIEVTDSGRKYYLYASRIANTSFNGKIVEFDQTSQSMQRSIADGKGWINVVIEDLNDKTNSTTVTTDGDGNFTVDDMIPGNEYEVTPVGGTSTTVIPNGDGDDIGTITITEGVNFKTTIAPQSSSRDMMNLIAGSNLYNFNIIITNTGSTDCLAATYSLDIPADMVAVSVPASQILGTIEPHSSKTIPISLYCKETIAEYEYKKIGITIIDQINNKSWNDSVSLKFYKSSININILSQSNTSGVIITPKGRAYSFRGTNISVTVPYSIQEYLIIFSGATANTETVYSIGIGTIPSNNFNGFTDLGNYEANNSEDNATYIANQNTIMSYLHKNDIDYYKVSFGTSVPQPVKPTVLVDYAVGQYINSQPKKFVLPGQTLYMDLKIQNISNKALCIFPIILMSSSQYVTIGSNKTDMREIIPSGYYQTVSRNYYTKEGSQDTATAELFYYASSGIHPGGFTWLEFTVSSNCPVGTTISFTIAFTEYDQGPPYYGSSDNTWLEAVTLQVQ